MSESRIAQLTQVPFGENEPMLHRALEAGGIGLWDYFPASGLIDLYHNVLAFQTLKPGRYFGPVAEFTNNVLINDQATIARLLNDCATGSPTVEAEFRILTQDGATVWLLCRGRHTLRDDGTTRYVGTLADVSASAERKLRLLGYHQSLFSLARNPLVVDRADFLKAARQIISEASATLNVARGSLWRFSEDQSSLDCLHQHDSRNLGEATVTDGDAPTVTLLATDFPTYFAAVLQRRSLAIADARTDPLLHEFRATYLPQTSVRAMLVVPVFDHGQLWGVVCFEDCAKDRVWDSDAEAFASSAVDLLSLAHEVAERAKSEAELALTRERHRAFIQASHDSIWSVAIKVPVDTTLPLDAQIAALREHAYIDDANDAFTRDYPLERQGVIGRRLSGFMPELFRGSSLRDWIDRGYRLSEREMRLRVKGEQHHWLSLTLLGVVEDGKLVRIWGARRNITDRKRYQSLLEHLAFRDPLTGLLNRQRLVSEVNELIDSGKTAAVGAKPAVAVGAVATLLLLDLNQFKDVNDTLGHGAGDEVLRQMKARFDEALVNETAIAARLGGDEFGVFVRGVGTAEGAMRIGQAITEALARPFIIGGGKFHVSASIGAAIYPTHGSSFSELSRSADEAMYHAKQTGGGVRLFSRNTVVFERRKLLLLADLPEAIDRGELTLEFQPIINCMTRRPVRMEALVRWNHPEYGRLTAQDFVYKAEMSDSIRVLTRWVIEQALQAAHDWQSTAPGIGVAINISPRLLGDSSIVAHLQASIHKFGLSARLVDLEITETSLIHNPDRAAQILADCRALGFSIVIDDYGVGFCSLAYLRRLPLKGLKMDASFVSRVTESAEDAVIVQSTITLAHNLGLTVVAEGVEDAATLGFLEFHGCDFAQGFDISRPMDIASTLVWLQEDAKTATAPASPNAPPLRVVS